MMHWILRVTASVLASLGILGLIIMIFPQMHWNLWQGTAIVLTMGYIVWMASLLITGLYWARGNEQLNRNSKRLPDNVIVWPGSGHLSKGPKAS
ncbi:MAG: hypothetical protein M1493_13495 [Firmicutes bacterium]|jgi:hypothetical protein|uniref:Uncharacterized protein n=1 Tax=Sulfobacillus benefaciens TaxID=453960 RepID=A0A2T2WLT1_9FIRM|nr:hypothetical protein [Bacillota bacterium]PSR23183.1 MAG: hypothetical protein C7B43_20260 [Sulfobacillus benefaciens]HBQ94966.1 hypothetical protein [Sulfobacillus sp.]